MSYLDKALRFVLGVAAIVTACLALVAPVCYFAAVDAEERRLWGIVCLILDTPFIIFCVAMGMYQLCRVARGDSVPVSDYQPFDVHVRM